MFDSDFLKQLEYLSLLSKRMFQGQLLAQRRTMQTGGGIEFSDHREYMHGDDLRYLDWNVYARHGDLLLKRFQEEEDLHVYLLLDASLSMEIDDPSSESVDPPKFTLARQIAAALAYIALADMDRVSIYAYADGVQVSLPLVRGKDQILSVLRFLEGLRCRGDRTDLRRTVGEFVTRAPRKGLAIVISDLFDQDGFREGVDRLRYAQFEPHVIQIHTRLEAEPKLLGDVQLVDCESGTEKKVTVTEKKLRHYRELFTAFVNDVETYCRMQGLAHTRTTTDVPFDAVLLKMMRAAAVG
jgi:uncharacterized protein (DUF58 family)